MKTIFYAALLFAVLIFTHSASPPPSPVTVPLQFFGMSWFNSTYPFAPGITLGVEGKSGHGGLAGQGQLIDNIAATCANSTSPSDACYTWTDFDTFMNLAATNNWKVIFDWDIMPMWMCPSQAPQSTNPHCVTLPNLTAVANIATAIATRYRGKIQYYETDNEANLAGEWQDTCANLVLLHNTERAAILAGDSGAKVGAPNVASGHLGLTGGCTSGPAGDGIVNEWIFIQNFLQTQDINGHFPVVDAVGHHAYENQSPALNSVAGYFLTVYNNFRSTATAASIPTTTPILVTEGSWGLSTPNPNCSAPANETGCLTSQQQIAYVGRWLVLGASTFSDGGGMWGSWYAYDIVWGTLNGTSGMNPLNAAAYAQMESWLTGATFASQCTTGTPSTVYICPYTAASGQNAEIIFNNQNGTAVNFSVPSWATFQQPLQGSNTAISGGIVTVNDTPILLTEGGSFAATPNSLAFGAVLNLTKSAGQIVAIKNNSGGTVTLLAPVFTGTNSNDFSSTGCSSGTLANGSTCNMTVFFSPAASVGTVETASVGINYVGYTGPPVSVTLTGTSGNSTPPSAPTGLGNTVH
jgi:hypothetical protein